MRLVVDKEPVASLELLQETLKGTAVVAGVLLRKATPQDRDSLAEIFALLLNAGNLLDAMRPALAALPGARVPKGLERSARRFREG